MVDPLSFMISVLSLAVSFLTAWLTLFRRGTVKMTRPTIIFFTPGAPLPNNRAASPTIHLRMRLFSTAKRGRVVESMHVALQRNESHHNFNIWVYGEKQKMNRGSGLFVGEAGISEDHYFLIMDDSLFRFTEGHYSLSVFANIHGMRKPLRLFTQSLDISRDLASALEEQGPGVFFDWRPDSSRYLPRVGKRQLAPNAEEMQMALGMNAH